MSEKKSITIDSNSLLGGGGGSSSKRKSSKRSNNGNGERKIRPSSIVQPSTLKKTLLERIKQHQRTRERSREETDRSADTTKHEPSFAEVGGGNTTIKNDNFSQSIDFLRKLALKRRQQTQKRSSSSANNIQTPESHMLNKVAETLHNGEILTNTGLLGLPVVPMLVPHQQTNMNSITSSVSAPSISLEPMPMPMPNMSETPAQLILPETPPKITDLANMYNNTVAAATPETTTDSLKSSVTERSNEPVLHIPQNPEDYLPSIFIKDEPPHGCLKNGKKPTFREWASKILGGGKPPYDGGMTGDGGGGGGGGGDGGGGGGVDSSNSTDTNIQSAGGGDGDGSVGGIDPSQIAGMRVKIRKTHKKRYRIGKHDDVVGVLLKNKQTQRHIQSQHLTLRQKSIGEIRKYLYDHHLLKIGSNAPPDVLRRMYEDAILTGDVKNTNDGVMLHNFMSGGGGE